MFANAVVAVGIFIIGAFGLLSAESSSQTKEATGFFVVAAWFLVVATSFALKSRLLVVLTSVPVVLAGGILFFVLLFAGFSWGEQGILTARILQAISFVIVVLQILGLIAVFTSQRKRQDRDSAASS